MAKTFNMFYSQIKIKALKAATTSLCSFHFSKQLQQAYKHEGTEPPNHKYRSLFQKYLDQLHQRSCATVEALAHHAHNTHSYRSPIQR